MYTHSCQYCKKRYPRRDIKTLLAKKIFKNLEKEAAGEIPEEINTNIPNYKEIADHREAKATMKAYVEEVIAQVEEKIEGEKHTKTYKVIEKAREILEDPKFIEQKSIRSYSRPAMQE